MTDEEKKAIEIFQKYIDFCKNNKECREELKNCFGCTVEVEEINAMKTILNLIQKQEKVIDEKDKLLSSAIALLMKYGGYENCSYNEVMIALKQIANKLK